jgi:hypothetical protein
MRRVPFGSEAGDFRFTLTAGLVIGASMFIGWLDSPAAGLVVVAAATVSAALSRLCVALRDRPAALRRAMSEAALDRARPHAGHHVLVVANEALAGAELAELILQHCREHVEVDVIAPVLASHIHYAVSDIDSELAEARTRLEDSLAWAREHKIAARGEVGDPNPTTALEDELRTFGADEVIVVTHPRDRETWQERGELARLRRELDVPVTHVVVRKYRSTPARAGPRPRPPVPLRGDVHEPHSPENAAIETRFGRECAVRERKCLQACEGHARPRRAPTGLAHSPAAIANRPLAG